MKKKSTLAALVIFGLATLGAGRSALAAGPHVDRLALDLQRQSRELMTEFARHYRHAPDFRHLMADSSDLFRQAVHIHSIAHNTNNLHHLNADLAKIDRSFHHLEGVVEGIEHHVRFCHSPRCGHFHGDTRHVRALMGSIEDTIHHLRDDVLARSQPPIPQRHVTTGYGHVARSPVVRPSVARRSYGYGHHRGSSRLGHSGWRFNFGF